MRVFAIHQPDEDDKRVWPHVQLIFEICDCCHCIRVCYIERIILKRVLGRDTTLTTIACNNIITFTGKINRQMLTKKAICSCDKYFHTTNL